MLAALATLHLAPTELAADLPAPGGRRPGERIRVVGNPVLDAVRATGVEPASPLARAVRRPASPRTGPPTSTTRGRLAELVVRRASGSPRGTAGVLFPVHPRTRDRLRAAGLLGGARSRTGCPAGRPAALRRPAARAGRQPAGGHRQRRPAGGGVLPRRARRRDALDHPALGGRRARRGRAHRAATRSASWRPPTRLRRRRRGSQRVAALRLPVRRRPDRRRGSSRLLDRAGAARPARAARARRWQTGSPRRVPAMTEPGAAARPSR